MPALLTVEDTRFGNIPDGGGLYYVPNNELLNGLVLGHTAGAVGAANRLHVAAAFFGTTIIPSFLGLHQNEDRVTEGAQLPHPEPPTGYDPRWRPPEWLYSDLQLLRTSLQDRSKYTLCVLSTMVQGFKSSQPQKLFFSGPHASPRHQPRTPTHHCGRETRERMQRRGRLSYIPRDPYAHTGRLFKGRTPKTASQFTQIFFIIQRLHGNVRIERRFSDFVIRGRK